MNYLLLIKLITAHILADFPLQPDTWITNRREKHWKAGSLWGHVFLHGILAWLFIFQLQAWWVALVIAFSHLIIDIWKSYRPEKLRYFFVDQGAHLVVILIVWGFFTGFIYEMPGYLYGLLKNGNVWLMIMGYVLVIWPVGIIIQQFVKYRFEMDDDDQGLKEAGKWIGYFERILVLTFVLLSAYSALGLLIAAKSILRIGVDNKSGRKQAEYILIGTLMSWALAILVGVMIRYALMRMM